MGCRASTRYTLRDGSVDYFRVRFYRASFLDAVVELGRIIEDVDLTAAESPGSRRSRTTGSGVPRTWKRWELPAMRFRAKDGRLAEAWVRRGRHPVGAGARASRNGVRPCSI